MANFYGSYIGYGSGGGASVVLFQGEFFGYAHGGHQAGPTAYDRIDRWSYTADTNATDVGNLSPSAGGSTGSTDGISGFASGGWTAGYSNFTDIQKYSYASATEDATDHGDLHHWASTGCGVSDMENGYGYHQGGYAVPSSLMKQKYAFSSNTTATDAGDLSVHRQSTAGSQDTTHGYAQSGQTAAGQDNTRIDRFAFASDGDSVDCGDVTRGRGGTDNGSCSLTRGYKAGGYSSAITYTDVIDNHTFASTVIARDVGNLGSTNQGNSSNCSTTYGYAFGGQPPATLDTIWKWSFASDTQAGPDTGADLSLSRVYLSGTNH